MLINHGTGLGKTLTALKIAENYINSDNSKKITIVTVDHDNYKNTILYNQLVDLIPKVIKKSINNP